VIIMMLMSIFAGDRASDRGSGLHGHVQRRGRLIAMSRAGLQLRAMAIMTRWRIPPAQLVGVFPNLRAGRELRPSRPFPPPAPALARVPLLMQQNAFRDLVADREDGVQRGHGS